MIREIYIINKKTVQDFENEIGFEIESDYVIVLHDKKDGSVIGEVYNVFGDYFNLDFNPEYDINTEHIKAFLQKFLQNKDDSVWNNHIPHLTDLTLIDENESKWKDRMGYVYLN